MSQNIMFDISPEKSSSDEEEFEIHQTDQQRNSIMSVRAPNLFESCTPQQQFQQIPDPIPSIKKQTVVTFDTLNTSDCERRQLNKWNIQEKENQIKNGLNKNVNQKQKKKQSIHESQDYIYKQQKIQQKQIPQQKNKNINYSSIDNFQNHAMAQEFLELDLPALIQQIAQKRRNNNNLNINTKLFNSLTKPQTQIKQGCIVKQQLGKQNSQIFNEQHQGRERSNTMIMRQPGKIVNQKQLRTISNGRQ